MKKKIKSIVIIGILIAFSIGGISALFTTPTKNQYPNIMEKINQKERHVVVIMSKYCEYCSKLAIEIADRKELQDKVTYLYQEELPLGVKNQLADKGFLLKGTPESYVMVNGTIQKVVKGFNLSKVNELEMAIKGE